MCGIIGIISDKPVADPIFDGLKRLEYRGYDSAGIATLTDGQLHAAAPKANCKPWPELRPRRCRGVSASAIQDGRRTGRRLRPMHTASIGKSCGGA